jgi:hypothetical protein
MAITSQKNLNEEELEQLNTLLENTEINKI